jgi:pyruvate kinase
MLKKTKIIATVGPACSTPKILKALIDEGVNIFRINASHTQPAELIRWVKFIRKVSQPSGKAVGILVDLQGPRVRTGKLKDGKMVLKAGEKYAIIPSLKIGSGREIATATKEFPRMVKAGDKVLLDNGFMELEVLSVKPKRVECRVITPGVLGENKGINLPDAPVTLPAFGQKDRRDMEAAIKAGADYIALSFVRSEEDVLTVKRWLARKKVKIPVIAKIEKPRALKRIEAILNAADGIMIARGDLGIEMGVEKVPVIQKELITAANRMRLPVITATQMLESMMTQSRPSRAEASDIANAVFDGTDAVMLSGETAIGKNPVQCVRVMSQIILQAEGHSGEYQATDLLHSVPTSHEYRPLHAITHAARHAAKDLYAKAIIVFTSTGKTAALIAKFRPKSPIIALTPSDEISRRLCIWRGIYPMKVVYGKTIDAMIREGDKAILGSQLLNTGDVVLIVSGKLALPTANYLIKIHWLGGPVPDEFRFRKA